MLLVKALGYNVNRWTAKPLTRAVILSSCLGYVKMWGGKYCPTTVILGLMSSSFLTELCWWRRSSIICAAFILFIVPSCSNSLCLASCLALKLATSASSLWISLIWASTVAPLTATSAAVACLLEKWLEWQAVIFEQLLECVEDLVQWNFILVLSEAADLNNNPLTIFFIACTISSFWM